MKNKFNFRKWALGVTGIGLAWVGMLARFGNDNFSGLRDERVGGGMETNVLMESCGLESVQKALNVESQSARSVLDVSIAGFTFLISRRSEDGGGELWLQRADGEERLVSKEALSASFSPDGRKFAYATAQHELFIETVSGESLAQLFRASEPVWRSDSLLSFSAIPDDGLSELQQVIVYDLNADRIATYADGD